MPAIFSNLLNAVYNIVDQIYIGHGVGYGGIAATNVAFPLITITAAISIMLGVGCASNFNLSLGAGDQKRADKIAGNGLTLMVAGGVVLAVISLIFLHPLLRLFGANDEIMGLAVDYTSIVALGIPFQVVTVGACQLVRADGNPNWAMLSMVAGAVFNVIFNPLFMYTFGLGIKGIAWVTVLGQVLSASLALSYIIRGMKTARLSKSAFIPTAANAKAICALGMSGFANQMAMTVVNTVLNNTLNYYGEASQYGSTVTLGAVGAITKINIIFIACVIGLSQGCQPINGFNYGAKNYDRVKETLKTLMVCAAIVSVIFFAAYQLLPRQIIGLFGKGSDEYVEFAVRYLRVFKLMTFTNWLQPLAAGFFTSIGKAKVGIFISLTRQIIFLLPLLLILPVFMGIDGVVYAGPISDSVAAVLGVFFIVRELKRLDKLINDE